MHRRHIFKLTMNFSSVSTNKSRREAEHSPNIASKSDSPTKNWTSG